MFTPDSIIVGLIVLAALTGLGWRYYKKWKSPKACGLKNCGCAPKRRHEGTKAQRHKGRRLWRQS